MDLKSSYFSPKIEFIIVVFGIYTSYLYFGILQEHIYKNPNREPFKHAEFVVLCQMLLGSLISFIVSKILREPKNSPTFIKLAFQYSLPFAYSMFFTNYSLTLISYPTQALAKSCKILPTLLGSIFVKDVHYHPLQYIGVIMITSGVVMFNWKGTGFENDSVLGLIVLFLSLTLDSFTSYYAEYIRRSTSMTSMTSLQIMHSCCSWGAIVLLPVIFLVNIFSEDNLILYLIRYPSILIDILYFGIASAIGQTFIFWALKIFGPLSLSIITTVRKFLAVFASVIWFKHALSSLQWGCMILVFSGTLMDMIVSHNSGKKKIKEKENL
ncbi:hypothetical protein SteCoe_35154 [Stentor coeruleus]|uniref:Sugar phosphate transporter domain-containing protein n=1 Tax=Stentor coeruleus TaxID=5963 RepID=A0A1R2ASX5_9CILI|nr:hypothetical protein SteCoe_35154 [Stentor coeruleus]